LRGADVNAQGIRLRQPEQFVATGGIDQLADVGIARGDGAVKRSDHPVEVFQFFQAADIGLCGGHVGLLQNIIRLFLGSFLLADARGFKQFRPAIALISRDPGWRWPDPIPRGPALIAGPLPAFRFPQHLIVRDVIADVHNQFFK